MHSASKKFPNQQISNFEPEVTIFLPMKNESSNVIRKINEVAGMDYPLEKISLIVIDSGSFDDTAYLAKKHLKSIKILDSWKVISLDAPGKSIAVNHALDIIDTDFFIMMDADSSCNNDSIRKLISWFSDDRIGAVCGQFFTTNKSPEFPYRSRFNTLRVGESYTDSTPIFEGSLCAFRIESFGGCRIDGKINADDSQMAMLGRSNGFRSIMDPKIIFSETSGNIARERKVRRAQGIIRSLCSNYRLSLGHGKFSRIMMHTIYFHILFPLLFFFSIFSMLVSLYYNFQPHSTPSHFVATPILIICFLVMSRSGRNLILGSSILIEAQIKLFAGKTLENWHPIREE